MTEEIHTCRRRTENIGPWENAPNLDTWRVLPNGDRTCSFCGSMHPEDLLAFMEKMSELPGARLEMSDKSYKMYIHRPEVSNAGDGAIKFYMWHIGSSEMADKLQAAHDKVADLSRQRSEEVWNSIRSRGKV